MYILDIKLDSLLQSGGRELLHLLYVVLYVHTGYIDIRYVDSDKNL
jgi:hypothetical protein